METNWSHSPHLKGLLLVCKLINKRPRFIWGLKAAHTALPHKGQTVCPPRTEVGRTQSQPSTHWHSHSSLLLISSGQQTVVLPLGRRVHPKERYNSHFCATHRCRAPPTWSNSCFPVVLGWMANSSSASMVVTRTLICREGQR